MKLSLTLVLVGAFAGGVPDTSFSAEVCSAQETKYVEASSLRGLPKDVLDALGASRSGLDGIADRGQKFNDTDDVDSILPWRRFAIAGFSPNCLIIAIERGGRGYRIEAVMFTRAGSVWRSHSMSDLYKIPRSVDELLIATGKKQ